jgi:hypothetical protein
MAAFDLDGTSADNSMTKFHPNMPKFDAQALSGPENNRQRNFCHGMAIVAYGEVYTIQSAKLLCAEEEDQPVYSQSCHA